MNWEKKIIGAFESRYYASESETGQGRRTLRLRTSTFFPDFDNAHPDEKVSYLEAAESLERRGIIKLNWEKRGKGERLKTLTCENSEKIFEESGKPYPKTEAEKIRATLSAKVQAIRENAPAQIPAQAEQAAALLEYFSNHFGPREIGQGIDHRTMEEFVRFLEFRLGQEQAEKLTTRALSILLYRDSKRLENLLSLLGPLVSRAQKAVPLPDISFPERSYPETMIAGKIIIEFKNEKTPLVNEGGHILGLPLETAEEIAAIRPLSGNGGTVLTIENKETFYALGKPDTLNTSAAAARFDSFFYAGGYSNRAATAVIKALAASGFSFFHAGDLDPDGILILQHISELAGKPVAPLRMDAATFDQYKAWARSLDKTMLRQIGKITEKTKSIPGLADLLHRIEETGWGVEQEIIDYR